MKKLVIKTVIIVLSIIVSVVAITFGILCSTNPRALAKGFESLGDYSASKYFYERQYEKTENIDDLMVLIDLAYGENDKVVLQSYLAELISHTNFNKFCNDKNATLIASLMKTEEYYSAFYTTILYENGRFDQAVRFSESYVDTMGYTKFNPFTQLISAKQSTLTAEQKNQIKSTLQGYLVTISDAAQISLINQDINKLG